MVKRIALGILVLLGAVLVVAATKPDTFRVQRTISVHASPQQIQALVEDFHAWRAWSPYEKLDPAMTRTLSGASKGKGAVYTWSGDGKAGAGRMQILESSPQLVKIRLDFTKPMEGHNIAEFHFEPDGDVTNVTWSMHGPNPYYAKVASLVFNIDKMVGGDFETGLASLKTIAEK